MSLGFQKAGFDILAGFEHWDVAISCYKKNFTHPVEDVDLSDVKLSVQTIIKYNPDIIKNPNHVPYGTTIKIPELVKK